MGLLEAVGILDMGNVFGQNMLFLFYLGHLLNKQTIFKLSITYSVLQLQHTQFLQTIFWEVIFYYLPARGVAYPTNNFTVTVLLFTTATG